MEETTNLTRFAGPRSSPPCLSVRKESHLVSKQAPRIRIVHIFAPEIIKTDVANFRELVQRLTGKPVGAKGGKKKKPAKTPRCKAREETRCNSGASSEYSGGSGRVKEEEETWGGGDGSSLLGALGDLDSFIQGLHEFAVPHMDLVFGAETVRLS